MIRAYGFHRAVCLVQTDFCRSKVGHCDIRLAEVLAINKSDPKPKSVSQ